MPRLRVRSLTRSARMVEAGEMRHHFPFHTHHSLIIGLLLKGERRMLYLDESLLVRRGQIFIVNSGEAHACSPTAEQTLDYRVVCIRSETLSTLFPVPIRFPHRITDPQAVQSLADCLATLEQLTEAETREKTLVDFILSFARTWAVPALGVTLPPVVRQTAQYLDEHNAEKIDFEDLGEQAALSPYHLNRLFHRSLGLPPHAYQLQAKIQRAQTLLVEGFSPTQAAYELGFSDQSHFCKFFKKYVGITPASYQRQNRETDEHVPSAN